MGRILLLIALGEGLEKAPQGRHGRSLQGLSLSKGRVDSQDLYLEKSERDLDSKERCNLGRETVKKKNKAGSVGRSGKEVREGHILDLHPSKTLRNGSASPSQSRGKKDTEGRGKRAEMQLCKRMNENRIEKVNRQLGKLCCCRVKLD